MSLFSLFCFNCKMSKPREEIKRNGSMAEVAQLCSTCGPRRAFQWNSQPCMLGKYPDGNLMISFGILMSGVNISKTMLLFKHMGLCSISIRTYFIHQTKFLFPSVLLHWEKYRRALIEKIKRVNCKLGVVMGALTQWGIILNMVSTLCFVTPSVKLFTLILDW